MAGRQNYERRAGLEWSRAVGLQFREGTANLGRVSKSVQIPTRPKWHSYCMPPAFYDWKLQLLSSAGSTSSPVRQLGDHVLELFWRDGCEPNMSALLDYAQAGLCRRFNIKVSEGASAQESAES